MLSSLVLLVLSIGLAASAVIDVNIEPFTRLSTVLFPATAEEMEQRRLEDDALDCTPYLATTKEDFGVFEVFMMFI